MFNLKLYTSYNAIALVLGQMVFKDFLSILVLMTAIILNVLNIVKTYKNKSNDRENK